MTYKLSLTLPAGATINEYYILFENCLTQLSISDGTIFTYEYDEVCNYLISYYGGTCTYIVSGDDVTFTLNPATMPSILQCCEPVALFFILDYDEGTIYRNGAWIPQETTLCSDCQDLNQPDCAEPVFDLGLPNGTYTVTLKDNTAQTYYTQTINFDGGAGTWDDALSAGIFTPYNVFTVTIEDSNGDPVTWTEGSNEYNCIRLTFSPTTNTTD